MSVRLANKIFHVTRIFGVTFVSLASILCLYSLREQVNHKTHESEDGEKVSHWDSVNEEGNDHRFFDKIESNQSGKLLGTFYTLMR